VNVYYCELAEADLDEVASYTTEAFGAEQCEICLRMLEDTCERTILRFPDAGRPVAERPGLRRWRYESHAIYFRVVADGMEIVRILHERMLPDRHL
jgi:toxin ParE1/3/4